MAQDTQHDRERYSRQPWGGPLATRYIAPIAVELLVREAQSLRGYPAGDRRTVRLVEVTEELLRLGAGDVLDQIEDEDDGTDWPVDHEEGE